MKKILIASLFIFAVTGCGDLDDTLPAEVMIESVNLTPFMNFNQSASDAPASRVLLCAGWTNSGASGSPEAMSNFTTDNYTLDIREPVISGDARSWAITIRILANMLDIDSNRKQQAVENRMCEYLRDEPTKDTNGLWERIDLIVP